MSDGRTIRLPDGRTLCYADYGDPDGYPVVVGHGNPGSRFGCRPLNGRCYPPGIRVIAPDRPGFGGSDPHPGRTLLDWTDDVRALVDRLGLDRFSVVGVSGGAPYALACAWRMPERVATVGVVSSGLPVNGVAETSGITRTAMFASRRLPWLVYSATSILAPIARTDFPAFVRRLPVSHTPADWNLLQRDDVQAALGRAIGEALRQGGAAFAHDLILFARPWPFDLSEITAQVQIWQGAADKITPPAWAGSLAAALPNCTVNLIPDAGHLWVTDNVGTVAISVVRAAGETRASS